MSLEAAYRRMLRWYPRSWRAANADVVLGTLLDAAEAEGRVRPRLAERLDLAANGLATRIEPVLPRAARDLAASLALGIAASLAAVYLLGIELHLVGAEEPAIAQIRREVSFGPFMSVAGLVMVAWVAAFVLGVLGARLATAGALVVAFAASVVAVAAGSAPWAVMRPSATLLALLALLGLVAGMGDTGRDVRRSVWCAASAAVAFVVFAGMALAHDGLLAAWTGRLFLTGVVHVPTVVGILFVPLLVALVLRRADAYLAVLLVTVPWGIALLAPQLRGSEPLHGVAVGLGTLLIAAVAVAVAWRLHGARRTQVVRPARR